MRSYRLIPFIAALFVAGAGIQDISAAEEAALRIKTVVIDPGHGGHDPGCVSPDKKTYEKTLTLDIGKRFADKIKAAYPDVKVILTRDSDSFVTLGGRADTANNASADLFISIHINAIDGNSSASGYSVHCLGQSSKKGNDLFGKNLALCKRENSVILMEEDYKTTYQGFDPSDTQSYIFFSLLQNSNLQLSLALAEDINNALKGGPIKNSRGVSQDPFLVLWRTTMPAVLIECAFISNPTDLAALRDKDSRDDIAARLLKAFTTYKKRYEGSAFTSGAENDPAVKPAVPAKQEEPPKDTVQPDSTVWYGTQVLATSRTMSDKDPFFKGYSPKCVISPKLRKYFIGVSGNLADARKANAEIKKKFSDCFMVKFQNGEVTRIK